MKYSCATIMCRSEFEFEVLRHTGWETLM